MDQMAWPTPPRPARGYKRRRGTLKTNSHKMWPTSWGVVGIVYQCCCVCFWTRVHICGGSFGRHEGHIILALSCSDGPYSPYQFQNLDIGIISWQWRYGTLMDTSTIFTSANKGCVFFLNNYVFALAGWIWCQVSASSNKEDLFVSWRKEPSVDYMYTFVIWIKKIFCALHWGRPACLLP